MRRGHPAHHFFFWKRTSLEISVKPQFDVKIRENPAGCRRGTSPADCLLARTHTGRTPCYWTCSTFGETMDIQDESNVLCCSEGHKHTWTFSDIYTMRRADRWIYASSGHILLKIVNKQRAANQNSLLLYSQEVFLTLQGRYTLPYKIGKGFPWSMCK